MFNGKETSLLTSITHQLSRLTHSSADSIPNCTRLTVRSGALESLAAIAASVEFSRHQILIHRCWKSVLSLAAKHVRLHMTRKRTKINDEQLINRFDSQFFFRKAFNTETANHDEGTLRL